MVGNFLFGHDPVYPSKPVDDKVVCLLAAHILQERFANSLERAVFTCCERGLLAFRSVEDNTCGVRPVYRRTPVPWKRQVGAAMGGDLEPIVDPEPIAVG